MDVPTNRPRTVPFAPNAPCGIVIAGVSNSTESGFELVRSTTRPPAGAAFGIVTGKDAVEPTQG